MIKKYYKDLGVYGITFIITKGISIILLPFYIRVLSAEDYGTVELITIISAPLGVLFSLEIYQSIARFIADLKDSQKSQYVSSGFFYYLFAFSILAAIIFIFSEQICMLLFNMKGREGILRIAGFSLALNSLFFYLQAVLRYSLQSGKYSVSNIVFTLTTIGFSLYFVLINDMGLAGVYYGQLIGAFSGLMIAIYYNRAWLRFTIQTQVLKEMLRFSLPLVPSGLSVYLLTYCDRIFIQIFLTLGDLGVFAVSYRIASVSYIIMTVFYNSFVPVIYNYYNKKEVAGDILYVYRFTFFAMLSVISIFSLFAKDILIMITAPEYYSASVIIPFLLLSGFFFQFGNLFLGLAIAKKTKLTAYINVFSALLNIMLNLIFIPLFGLVGAAIATFGASLVVSFLQIAFSQKYYFLNIDFKPFIKYFAASIIMIGLSFLIQFNSLTVSILVKLVLICIFYIIAIRFSGIINKQEIMNMIRRRSNEEA